MNNLFTNIILFISGILIGYAIFLFVIIILALIIAFFPFIFISLIISNWD